MIGRRRGWALLAMVARPAAADAEDARYVLSFGACAAPTGDYVGQLLRAAMTTLEGEPANQNVEPLRGSGPAV